MYIRAMAIIAEIASTPQTCFQSIPSVQTTSQSNIKLACGDSSVWQQREPGFQQYHNYLGKID